MKNPFLILKQEIHSYGYDYSFKQFLQSFIIFILFVLFISYVYRLEYIYFILLLIEVILLLPWLIRKHYRYLYEKQRFDDVVIYLEALLYAFKKSPKIMNALEDAYVLSKGKMKELLYSTCLKVKEGKVDHYHSIFDDIENSYHSRAMREIHRYLIDIEMLGGEYFEQIDLFIEDLAAMQERVFAMQKERQRITNRIIFSIILSMLIMTSSLFMIPTSLDITSNFFYQFTTYIVLSIFLMIYAYVKIRLQRSWLDEKEDVKESKLLKRLEKDPSFMDKKDFVMMGVILVLAFYSLYLKQVFLFVGLSLVFSGYGSIKKIYYRRLKNQYCKELEKAFPVWLRSMGLYLQSENVHLSLYHSLEHAPRILLPHLNKLYEKMEENPGSIEPFDAFLKEYQLPFIARGMKAIYSLLGYGHEKARRQVYDLLKWNMDYMAKAERMIDEDKLAGLGLWMALPMLASSLKMMVDLVLLCLLFFETSGGI